MSMHDRAAQFVLFAALTGYKATVGETARRITEMGELNAQEIACFWYKTTKYVICLQYMK